MRESGDVGITMNLSKTKIMTNIQYSASIQLGDMLGIQLNDRISLANIKSKTKFKHVAATVKKSSNVHTQVTL